MSENHPIEEVGATEPTEEFDIVEGGEELLDGVEPPAPEYVVLPSVVIIGRPNVGKSTLFNKLTNTRKAIVGDEPGITRDRHYGTVEWQNFAFEIVDTGGIVPDEEAVIPANIFKQAGFAIDAADLLLWVVDARAGITPLDEEIARHLRATGKPVYVVANKAETQAVVNDSQEFHRFGFDAVYPVSAEHGTGAAELLDDAMKFVNAPPAALPQKRNIRVAIIGRPNVGKSSLVNRLLGQERVIVSPIAGTTRDAIDTELIHDGTEFTLIDTAGIRRKGKTFEMAEKLSVVMARKALERADVAILLLDAIEGPTNLDATIAGYALDSGTSIILGLNKWDAVEKDSTTMSLYERQLRERIKFLDYAPTTFISALKGQRVTTLLDLAKQAYAARHRRITTGELNRFFEQNLENPRASTPTNARVKIHYVTQARNVPPTFVLFTNSPKPLHFSYLRYIENRLRESFDFFGTPVRIVQKLKLKPKGK